MKNIPSLLLIALVTVTLLACAPTRPNDPAEFITANKAQELKLLGSWKLTTISDGNTPAPNQVQMLTFQNDHVLKMDLWEHQLTFKYEVAPDPDHLRLTWTGSTNPNDKPGQVLTRVMVINGDNLSLDGDQYKRTALANGATITPPAATAIPFTTNTPEANLPTPNTPSIITALLGQDFVLHSGETAMLTDSPDQFGITLYHINADSRCPQDVTCVRAGELLLSITFQKDGILHPPVLDMSSNPRDANNHLDIEGYQVQIQDVTPPALSTKTIAQADYAITFRVTHAESTTPTPTAAPNIPSVELDQPVTLNMFSTVQVAQTGLQLTLTGVLDESRCPKSVNCAQAGRALLAFRVEQDSKLGFLNLSTQPPDGRTVGYFRGFAIELVDVQPYPETPNQAIPAAQYSAKVVVHQTPPPTTAKKNQGFVLRVGQSVTLSDENATVQLESVTKDSRCPYLVSCYVRGNAVVQVKLTEANGAVSTFILNEDGSTPNQRTPDTGLFAVELVALNPYPRGDNLPVPDIAPDEYEATLVVRKFAMPQGVPTKTPIALTNCAGITAQDAQAITGEPMQPGPQSNVRIRVPADNDNFVPTTGICGFLSVAKNPSDTVLKNDPYDLENSSSSVIVAARLRGATVAQLLRIVSILRYASPDTDSTPYLLLKTRIAAGDWEGMFDNIQALAKDTNGIHVALIADMGDQAIWIWRQATQHNYAALIVRDGDEYIVIESLLGKTISEAAAQESLQTLMHNLTK